MNKVIYRCNGLVITEEIWDEIPAVWKWMSISYSGHIKLHEDKPALMGGGLAISRGGFDFMNIHPTIALTNLMHEREENAVQLFARPEALNKNLMATMMLSVRSMELEKVRAAYNALTGFGNVGQSNMAYKDLLDRYLINTSGKPTSSPELEHALQFVINENL